MRNQKRLGLDQQKFLLACRDVPGTLDELMGKVGITAKRVTRWLRRPYFRETISGVLGEVSRIKGLEFKLLVRLVINKLSKMASGQMPVTQAEVLMCMGVLEVDRRLQKQRSARRKKKEEESFDPRSLIHPDVSMEEAEKIFAKMRGDAPAPAPQTSAEQVQVSS